MSWLFPFFWLVFLAYPLAAAIRLDGAPRFWGVLLTIAFAVIFYIGMIVGGIGLGTFARTMRNPHAHRTRRTLIVVNAALIGMIAIAVVRSEEHTSELQSRFDLVCRLLLEKKK